ncbi:M20/M25/M40 family metallo-hydrolase [Devosia sp.]|uniref:M20/M25/M40 family metallo-hydrolase n=1 Tax=Devosia sp. TaxID=1871048 RepID=UPI003A8FE27D
MTSALDAALAQADQNLDGSIARLKTLIAIKSISTDPAFDSETRKAAEWLVAELNGLGFEAGLRDTPGHPMVVAHGGTETGTHALYYAHYDVQPVDPLKLWHTDPFDMTLLDAPDGPRLVGRGTSDDKGQLLTFVEACRAWKAANGELPIKLTIFFEGEEESGSKSLPAFLEANKAELGAADIALVCDTDMWDRDTPSIVTTLRGMVADEVTITCASHDLHSGMYGNAARNPIQVLAEIIASLRNPDGSVAIEGFYDDVAELPAEIKQQWDDLNYDEAGFLGAAGLTQAAGEAGRSVLEQTRARPTCEINGITGGYTGDGFKTVIPAQASAKISFRLVSDMQPDKIRAAFRAHVEARLPPDATVTFAPHGGSPAVSVPTDGELLRKAAVALKDEWGNEAALIGSGGSIPVAGDFKKTLGLDTLLIGFARDDDRIHSPNEKYDVRSYHKGIRSWLRIIAAFAE